MPTHAEKRILPYSPEQMFDLVAQVERYPEFLPWCIAARIRQKDDKLLVADLIIGFKMIRERFTSRVEFDRPRRIDVRMQEERADGSALNREGQAQRHQTANHEPIVSQNHVEPSLKTS